MASKLGKLFRDPIGVIGRRIRRVIEDLRFGRKDGYRAVEYWKERHGKYGFDLRGVGDFGKTQEENQAILDEGTKLVLELARREKLDLPRVKMLDVGCGTGHFAGVFRDAGVSDYTGIDIVDVLFDGLRERFPGFSFRQVDVSTTPIPDDYDLIIMMDVAQHITDEAKFRYAMENLKSHLKPEGVIIISTMIGPYQRHRFYVVTRPISTFQEIFNGFEIGEPLPFCGNLMFNMHRRRERT
jgi:2-polyprenyl-3-methyl-5-hydroxy-6-metoxy-1,4-benzoquinol methylase